MPVPFDALGAALAVVVHGDADVPTFATCTDATRALACLSTLARASLATK